MGIRVARSQVQVLPAAPQLGDVFLFVLREEQSHECCPCKVVHLNLQLYRRLAFLCLALQPGRRGQHLLDRTPLVLA